MDMKNLKFGVIGLRSGEGFVEHLVKHPRAELTGICDVDPAKLEQITKKFSLKIPTKTQDYRVLVANSEVDVVIVASPDHFHREQVLAALEAGKHVFCEKPLALTLDDCKVMIEAEKNANGRCFIGQVCRYAPGFLKAKDLVNQGVVGDLFLVESEYAHDYSNMEATSWRRDPRLKRYGFVGGGCHAVDLIRWVAGNPSEVSAYGNQKCLTDWPPILDAIMAIYRLPNDVIGKVFCSIGCKRPYTMRTVIYGTKGTIICDNTSSSIQVYSLDSVPNWANGEQLGFTSVPVLVDSHCFGREIDAFINAIENSKPIELTAREGARTVAVCVATVESAQNLKPVKISYL
jgi:predicted dehydrogenase